MMDEGVVFTGKTRTTTLSTFTWFQQTQAIKLFFGSFFFLDIANMFVFSSLQHRNTVLTPKNYS